MTYSKWCEKHASCLYITGFFIMILSFSVSLALERLNSQNWSRPKIIEIRESIKQDVINTNLAAKNIELIHERLRLLDAKILYLVENHVHHRAENQKTIVPELPKNEIFDSRKFRKWKLNY